MFPFVLEGDEELFHSLQKETHNNRFGPSITPMTVYAQHHSEWDVFASTFPHQAFLLRQLKSVYDNLDVVLRILSEKQKEGEIRGYEYPPPAIASNNGRLDFTSMDPFEFFLDDQVDYAHRKVLLDLFVDLRTDRRYQLRSTLTWREVGRSILDNSYDAERAGLVAELTSASSAEALNAGTGPSTPQAAIWRVRRSVVVREAAMQKAMARLRELLEEDKKNATKCSTGCEKSRRARSPVRRIRRERSWERSPVRERRLDYGNRYMPVRARRLSRSRSRSDEESVEIVNDRVEEA